MNLINILSRYGIKVYINSRICWQIYNKDHKRCDFSRGSHTAYGLFYIYVKLLIMLLKLKKELKLKANKKKAQILQGFFKTGPGEYGEGDIFLGVSVPEVRRTAKKFKDLSFKDLRTLLRSSIHEERLLALLILVHNFSNADGKKQTKIFDFYLKNKLYINNWDLVDLSAPRVVGGYLLNKNKKILYKLANSKNIWQRRIAIISTFEFIKNNNFKDTLKISRVLLKDEHDLIHKAVGWMLREVGKRDLEEEEDFLRKFYLNMPRTMLRYAIERFPEKKRQDYLKGRV